MYRVMQIQVKRNTELYDYLCDIGRYSNNLYNATLFRYRQIMTSRNKEVLSQNEISVLDEVDKMNTLLLADGKDVKKLNASGTSSYVFLEKLLRLNNNPDFKQEGLPRHTAQSAIRFVVSDMNSFFKAMKAYSKDNSAFTGKPELPKYKHKGGFCSYCFSNQEAVIKETKRGSRYLKLPLTKLIIKLGRRPIEGKLKEVQVSFDNGICFVSLILETNELSMPVSDKHERICAIDLGVSNVMAVTNNIDEPNRLYKGGILKSINHTYDKKVAKLQSAYTIGTNKKFRATHKFEAVTLKRNNKVHDQISKMASDLIKWCVEKRIDTIVIGYNQQWKTESEMDKTSNQNFIQIPHARLIAQIEYRACRNGISVIKTEESYTSKASYLDKDFLPAYKKDEEMKHSFSGRRIHRGSYQSKDGTIINADLNGSANIMRKVFDDADIRFDRVTIINNL